MAEFDDLLAGIRAHPHDELRRLVFADWLDENAHANPVYGPWAGYIRWAIAAANTPRTHPDYWAYRRYPEKPPEGVGKLLRLESQHFKFAWNGGFPDSLVVAPDTLVAHAASLADLPGPIRRLSVGDHDHVPAGGYLPPRWVSSRVVERSGELTVGIHATNDISGVPLVSTLAERGSRLPPLSLSFRPATSEVVGEFARASFPTLVGLTVYELDAPELLATSSALANLRSFSLRNEHQAVGRYDELASRVSQVDDLEVSGTGVPTFLTAIAADQCPRLTSLAITAQTADSPEWAAFAASPAFARLSRLEWVGRTPDTDTPIWPVGVPEPDAGELILKAQYLGPSQSVALLSSPLLRCCSCLFLSSLLAYPLREAPCQLTPAAYLALADNPSARNLKVLSVQMPFKSEPFARGEPFAALCRSPHLAGLTELSLTFHDLTDQDFEELLSATFADGLRYLNLAGSYFSERLLERLTDPDVLPALTWLDIHAPTNGSRRLEPALQKRFGPHFAF